MYAPTDGRIALNDLDVAGAGLRVLRQQCATVLQGDCLFNGSVMDNITFFERLPDTDFAIHSAKLACIDSDIQRMPMSCETLIGEMGSSLSQGQQQRVLLARALYLKRSILILDEGTAHLDEDTERKVLSNIRRLKLTVVMTATSAPWPISEPRSGRWAGMAICRFPSRILRPLGPDRP